MDESNIPSNSFNKEKQFLRFDFFFFFPILFFFLISIDDPSNGKWRHLQQPTFLQQDARSAPTYRRDPGFSCIVAPLPSFYSERLTRPPTPLPTCLPISLVSPLSRDSSSSAFNISRTNAHDGNHVG